MHSFDRRPRQIDAMAYIAPNATVVGDVHLAAGSSVWFGAVVRADTERVVVGPGSNVQDLALLHADPGFPCELGARVSVGHQACVHGAIVEDDVLVGIRAVVLNGCRIGRGSVIAAGSVLPEGTVVPPGSVVMGTPGKVVRPAEPRDAERIARAAKNYETAARGLLDPRGFVDPGPAT